MNISAFRLATRIQLAALVSLLAIGLILLALMDRNRREAEIAHHAAEFEQSLRLDKSRLTQSITTLRQDVLFLSRTPPVQGIIRAAANHGFDPRDGNTHAVWAKRLQEIFAAFTEAHPLYRQLSYVGVADDGRELVRVEVRQGHSVAVPMSELEQRGGNIEFRETARLANGEVFLSDFGPGGDPTLRVATPVYVPGGKLFGMIVVTMDSGTLIDKPFSKTDSRGLRTLVADDRGHILLPPESGQRPNTDFPATTVLADPMVDDYLPLRAVADAGGNRWLMAAERIRYDPRLPQRFIVLAYALPENEIDREVLAERWEDAIGGLVLVTVLGILMVFGLRCLLRPLQQITAAAQAIAKGERKVSLPDKASGEVGALARAFRLMLSRVDEREADLEERVLARTAELRLAASVVENTSEGVAVVDENVRIVSVNAAFTAITGYTAEEAVGQKASLLKSGHHDLEFYRLMWQTLNTEGHWQGEIWNRRKDGEVYLERLTINRIEALDGIPIHYVSVFHDITEMRRKDEHIRHLAFHDALTGLPNRSLLQDRLQHAIDRGLRENTWLAVMFLDLDRFKDINDTLGHDIGDLLLKEVALRLKTGLRSMDTVARLGGDEFVVLLEDTDVADYGANIAAGLIGAVARPMEIQGHAIQIGVSIGIALCPEDGCAAQELMMHADTAMYAAKTGGRNTYRFFHKEMTDQAAKLHQLEMELR